MGGYLSVQATYSHLSVTCVIINVFGWRVAKKVFQPSSEHSVHPLLSEGTSWHLSIAARQYEAHGVHKQVLRIQLVTPLCARHAALWMVLAEAKKCLPTK